MQFLLINRKLKKKKVLMYYIQYKPFSLVQHPFPFKNNPKGGGGERDPKISISVQICLNNTKPF